MIEYYRQNFVSCINDNVTSEPTGMGVYVAKELKSQKQRNYLGIELNNPMIEHNIYFIRLQIIMMQIVSALNKSLLVNHVALA